MPVDEPFLDDTIVRLLLEGSDDAVFVKDASGRYLYCNPAGARLIGETAAEVIGRSDDQLFGAAVGQALRREDQAILAAGEKQTFEETIETPNGVRHLLTTKLPLAGADGKPGGVVGIGRDVTELRRALLDLERRASMMHAVIEGTTDCAFVKDTEGRYVLGNTALAQLLGVPLSEILGRDDAALFRADDARRNVEDDRKVLASGQALTYEEELLGSAGPRVFHTTKGVHRDASGRPAGVFGIARDITERKQAERERVRLLAREQAARAEAEWAIGRIVDLQEITEAALRALDLDALFDDVLHRVAAVFQVDTVTVVLLSEDGGELVVRAALGLPEAAWRRLRYPSHRGLTGRVLEELQPVIVNDITKVTLASTVLLDAGVRSLVAVPLRLENRGIGVVHVGSLTTRRFTREEAVLFQLVADRLAVAIDRARVYEAERRARQAAEAAERSREELLAIVAHDLKSPLNAIVLSAELLARTGGAEVEKVRRYVETIDRSASRMKHLVRDLLDAARMEAGHYSVARAACDAAALVAEAVLPLRPLAAQREIELEVHAADHLPAISCDREAVLRVLANLLENAIKFTPDGGRVSVAVAETGGELELAVSDTGPGIPEEQLAHLFDRYWQARRASRSGAGLGLFISKGIVEAHGGRIRAESREGEGATFRFTLPVLSPDEARPGA